MAKLFPAGTSTIRSLKERFSYFLIVKPDGLADDIPQKEYFVYRFKVPVSLNDGISSLKKYFIPVVPTECKGLTDIEYATGFFSHPDYINQKKSPLKIKYKEIPIYIQKDIRTIDLTKDLYQIGSKPIILDETQFISESTVGQRRGGGPNINNE